MAAVSDYQPANPLTKHVLFGSGSRRPLRSSTGVVYHLAPPSSALLAIIGRAISETASELEKFTVCSGESFLKSGDFFAVFAA
jgi:hypothetical protein